MEYAAKRFGVAGITRFEPERPRTPAFDPDAEFDLRSVTRRGERQPDIKELREEKQPSSGIQMAVLVAYYLKALAPNDERQEAITAADVEKYFNQAQYPLPTGKNGLIDTLNNARGAGYFESAGRGSFKLNSVGFNLAAYNMPTKSKPVVGKQRKKAAKR
jgi:hypothetical protein